MLPSSYPTLATAALVLLTSCGSDPAIDNEADMSVDLITLGAVGQFTGPVTETLWPFTGFQGRFDWSVFTAAGTGALEIASTSAQDAPGGTGARVITVGYISAEGDYVEVQVNMNGNTPVPFGGTPPLFGLAEFYVSEAGSGGANAGMIMIGVPPWVAVPVNPYPTILVDGLIAGVGQRQSGVLTLPRGMWAFLDGLSVSWSAAGSAGALSVRTRQRDSNNSGVASPWRTHSDIFLSSSGGAFHLPLGGQMDPVGRPFSGLSLPPTGRQIDDPPSVIDIELLGAAGANPVGLAAHLSMKGRYRNPSFGLGQ